MSNAAVARPQRGAYGASTASAYGRGSPAKREQKHVVFQLIDTEDPRIQARLPMRVMISPHDPTDSIITTVKNFYGLYDYGVSFENKQGISIIAAYDNFDNDMTVYVRTVSQPPTAQSEHARSTMSPKKPSLGAPFEMRPPQLNTAQSPSRSAARSAGLRSMSPQSDAGRRSVSTAPGGKLRTHRLKSRDNSAAGDADGYSSGDNGEGSVTSSRRSKTEQVNAEISVDNIVEGGRRKRAFESSANRRQELPLFVPPQVPMSASISSISPQRRSGPGNATSPYAYSNQQTFSYTQPLPSPQSYGGGVNHTQSGMAANGGFAPNKQLRGRPNVTYPPPRHSNGIIPTPDPTVGSVISDEDVALQLMRLGDPTAFSHGRTSTSTVDDALSGKAEAASSDEEDDEDEDDDLPSAGRPAVPRFNDAEPQRKKQRTTNELPSDGTSGEEYEDHRDGTFAADGMQRKPSKSKGSKPRALSMAKPKSKPSVGHSKVPMSPSSLPTQSRKGSIGSTINFQHQLGVDEEDLSSKPRCQRCRKSKKGCDRQRPCGRCKDAGIGVEGCLSEDEGNGRKGRYGRHMGVPVKRSDEMLDVSGGAAAPQSAMPANGYFLAPALPDKSKKRKR
ncbi:hypothetical protein BAUCODRAFT_66299 [Baudoinia panamericana UAMH 10762]|uniref:Zn(2)-C6 fungal-type domain-containing protein n=1 Tax=Baudoinia panamericana (strain UAMH 10762) TaxID=717646 RepID=M2LV21_BAUPA|nr:uncharacterized protein BAUCODRAFT_66299 [Baudoinia panamericana UAMH 10762]EMC98462.1 hypothetical protein BAUCODRAFT_66299 [Baudoinia panamericana UAMH 10762]